MRVEHRVILLSFFLGLVYWLVDALADHFELYSSGKGFADALVHPDFPWEAGIRIAVLTLFLLLGWIAAVALARRRRPEELLRDSEERYRALYDEAPVAYLSIDAEGRIQRANGEASKLLGCSQDELAGRCLSDLCGDSPDDRALAEEVLRRLGAGGELHESQMAVVRPDGCTVWASLSASPVLDGQGKVVAHRLVAQDITERKLIETEREQAKVALEEVYARERRIAETLQRSFLPDCRLSIKGYRVADAYCPALDEAAVGGDVYDLFTLPSGKVGIVIADVSGKGLHAARYAAMVKYMLRAYAYRTENPATVLRMLNDSVRADLDLEMFITCIFSVLDPAERSLKYANAGHDEPLIVSHGSMDVLRLETTGPALGISPGSHYESRCLQLRPGQTILFYTDGVTDARGEEPPLGIEGLERYLVSGCALSAEGLVQCILTEVGRRSQEILTDDVALLAIEVLDEAEPAV